MKRLPSFLLILFLCSISAAQTNVDRVKSALDSLAILSMDNWKMSPDLKSGEIAGDPTTSGFDDSKWINLKLGENVYPDSCWLRREIVLPENILGHRVSGAVKLLVSVDDYGYMWINGVSKGYFPWDGTFVLTNNAKPGDRFLIAIRAINTGGPLRILRADVETENTDSLRQSIEDFSLSIEVGQELLSLDTKQGTSYGSLTHDYGVDRSKIDKNEKKRLNALLQAEVAKLDVDALRLPTMTKFVESLNSVRARLAPVAEFSKRFTLCFASNAHIDAAWLWRDKETVEICHNTFASVLTMMDAHPDFTYTQSAAAYYDWMEQKYPDVFNQIKRRVKEGRWEIVGGMWVEPDCNLPSGESWMHHLLLSKEYFKDKFGVDVTIGWNPDSFGYNWNMPQFYKDAGIDAFITQKIGWNETNIFPYRVFWWEGPDGSRILTYFPYDYVNEINNPFQLADWTRQFDAATGFTKMMVLFGVGDHGGGPTPEMLDRIDRLKHLDIYPRVEYCSATQYLNWLREQNPADIPTWKDELYLEYHQGTFTTQANMKMYNRRDEALLTSAEKFSSLATLYGAQYDETLLDDAWKKVLFNQFHDILPGSGIRENYIDATEKYKDVERAGKYTLDKSLQAIEDGINTSKVSKGKPFVVFNPLAWERTDVATLHLPEGDQSAYSVVDSKGKTIPSQIIDKGLLKRDLIFIADAIPSLGYKTYELRRGSEKAEIAAPEQNGAAIENEYFRVTVGTDSGWVTSIFDKKNNREILGGSGNRLQLLEDKPKQWDAWNIGLTGQEYPSHLRSISVVERGPVRTVIRIVRDCLGPSFQRDYPTHDFPSSFFTQDVILYNGIGRIDFRTDVDWWEEHTMLKVAFPLSIEDTLATYEIPYGSIQRSTQMRNSWETAKVEVPDARWADVSQSDYGVSLVNNSKYGYDIKGKTMRLSLLRSPRWPDPTADRGKHSIEYSIYPHSGTWREANTEAVGYDFNNPLIVRMTTPHRGKLAESGSFVKLEPSNLVLTTMKKEEKGDGWIVQWYDTQGKESEAVLTLPFIPKSVTMSNFLEASGQPVSFEKNVVKVPTARNQVVTIKVIR
ncbi:MAG TPA: glycoside hydrolase family 38 C-terminal domain-containing protein [Bacteroidota bacterium]|nr:glycoside hydrolase family 38 C-terminal domain-containing protein [Bacteroidota bacterium]